MHVSQADHKERFSKKAPSSFSLHAWFAVSKGCVFAFVSEKNWMKGVSFQGLEFRYTERGTLLITIGGSHQREFNPREAADLLTYLNTYQGDLFKNAEGDISTWPKMPLSVLGKSEIARNILDSYEMKNAYSEQNNRKHHDRE